MRRTTRFAMALAATMLAAAAMARADTAPAVNPAAMAVLQKMAAYLRTLKAFQVDAVTTDEDVLEDGQKIQYAGSTTVLAIAPNRLRAEVSNDRIQRQYLYDGTTLTLFAQRAGFYATVPAPPTIAQLMDKLDANYDFSVPLEDLFRWGTKSWDAAAIKGAMDVGPSEVAGVTCEQYAIRQDDVDWQIWIQLGEYPLPRKLVITTKTDEARPQHTAVFTWNLAPSYNDAAFKFYPPPGAERVQLLAAAAPAAGTKNAAAAGTKK